MYHVDPNVKYILPHQQYPHELHLLICQENKIGWRQLFHGRFSGEWSRIQSDYYYRSSDNRPGKQITFAGN
jgi:hypothetical protein